MSDDKDMRDLMDRDFEEIEAKLQNGHSADPATQGRALALLLRHVRVLVRRSTVTETECLKRRADCPGVKLFTNPKETVLTELAKQGGWIVICAYLVYLVVTK
jgi:hypothetical protein